jgi:histidinol-phosphate phosphatase family protein
VGVSSLTTLAPSRLAGEPVSAKLSGAARDALRRVPRAGALLDRDGTIIVDYGYVGSVECIQFIDGMPPAIARFNEAGLPVAVLTDQAGVARGFYGMDDVERVHACVAAKLAEHGAHMDLFVYYPYHPDGVVPAFVRASEDRKPRPGMAKAAPQALNLELASLWVVGDRPEHIGLAEAIGAQRLMSPRPSSCPQALCRSPASPPPHL